MTDADERAAVAERAARAGGRVAHDRFRSDIAVETKGEDDVVTAADRAAQRTVIESIRESFPDDAIVGEEGDERKTVPEEGAAWIIDPIDGTHNYVREIRVWGTAVAAVVDGEPVAAATVAPPLDDAYVADETSAWREPAGVAAAGDRDGDRDDDRTTLAVAADSEPDQFLVNPLFGPSDSGRAAFAAVAEPLLGQFGDLRRLGCAQLVLAGVASGQLHAAVSTVELNDWDTIAGVHLVRLAGGRVTDAAGDRWRPGATGLVASNGRAHEDLLAVTRE